MILILFPPGALKHSKEQTGREARHRGEYVGRKGVMPDAIPPPFGVTPGMMAPEGSAQRRHTVLDSPVTQVDSMSLFEVWRTHTSVLVYTHKFTQTLRVL